MLCVADGCRAASEGAGSDFISSSVTRRLLTVTVCANEMRTAQRWAGALRAGRLARDGCPLSRGFVSCREAQPRIRAVIHRQPRPLH